MAHVRLLFYILSLATGFAGITVTAILWVRIRDRILLMMLVIIGLFSLGLVLFAVIYYLDEIIIYPVDLRTFSTYANFIIVMVLYACICICVRWVSPDRSLVLLVMSAVPVFAVYIVFSLMGTHVEILSQWIQRRSSWVSLISVLSASLFLGYTGALLRLGSDSLEQPNVSFFVLWVGSMILGHATVSTTAAIVTFFIRGSVYPSNVANFLLFLVWNVAAVMTFIRYVSKPVDLFSSIPRESLERYGITRREAQVIELLSQGYTNKEIAEKLFVSFTTIRTHVYNIYQKVGAENRVDLLRILSAK